MGLWLSKYFVDNGYKVWILDNLSNSSERNIKEFKDKLSGLIIADVRDKLKLAEVFAMGFDICLHLAAMINVQDSIDNPADCFENNITGTFNVLEECRKHNTKMVFISSALIYESAKRGQKINEEHPLNPSCPYAASKIFGENLAMSYYKTYKLPVVILRPFNIYGPWQKSNSEGGVINVFIERRIKGRPLEIFGDGRQGRDFFYVEDCAEFIGRAAGSEKAVGRTFNAGSGREVKIKDLAEIISEGKAEVKFVKHHHPHAEIMNMAADSASAENVLGWMAKTTLEEGIHRTAEWLKKQG